MESLSSAIGETLTLFDLQHDINQINIISSKFKQMDSTSHQKIQSFNLKIDDLKKQLDNVKASIKSLKHSSSFKTTKSSIIQLENEIFETARSLTTLNMEINTLKLSYNHDLKKLDELETDLNQLRISFSSLPDISNSSLDKSNPNVINDRARIIKMKLFDSLGLKVDLEKAQITILNKSTNRLISLKIDDNYSDYFISNYIWDNM